MSNMEKSWSPCIAVGARKRHSYPLGEILLIGEGRGKAQHSHLCGGHCDSRDDQRLMAPPGSSNARDALPAITCRHAGGALQLWSICRCAGLAYPHLQGSTGLQSPKGSTEAGGSTSKVPGRLVHGLLSRRQLSRMKIVKEMVPVWETQKWLL
nr:prokineticin-2 isoform X4 [Odocoileus virginianus texanus]